MRFRHLIAGSVALAALANPAMGQIGAPAYHPPPVAAAPPILSPPPNLDAPKYSPAPSASAAAPAAKAERSLDDS